MYVFMDKLEWNTINGIDNKLNYRGNIEKGVKLPNIGETVLFCAPSYADEKNDLYISGEIQEREHGLNIVYPTGMYGSVIDGIKWARFNMPYTKNNTGYGLAYKDETGKDFSQNHPNIIQVEKEELEQKIEELKVKGCSNIIAFKYIKPCSFDYDWEYIKKNEVMKQD